MITKAIVEQVVSPYEVKVRIPLLDRTTMSSLATSTENLNSATICTLPNCYTNIQVGDVVFVGFEDNTYYKAVVLGHLAREAMTETYANVTFSTLNVREVTALPSDTSIGNVSAENIAHLEGTRDNLQKQIDNLKEQINKLMQAQGLE